MKMVKTKQGGLLEMNQIEHLLNTFNLKGLIVVKGSINKYFRRRFKELKQKGEGE